MVGACNKGTWYGRGAVVVRSPTCCSGDHSPFGHQTQGYGELFVAISKAVEGNYSNEQLLVMAVAQDAVDGVTRLAI